MALCGSPPDPPGRDPDTCSCLVFHPPATEYHLGLLKAKLAKYDYEKKDGLPYKTAHALSLVIIGIFAVPAVICFAVLWGVLGITDKLLDKLGGEGS